MLAVNPRHQVANRANRTARLVESFLARATTVSRQYCKSPRWKAEPVADLWPGHDDQRAFWRHLVEIGHDFDLIVAMLKDIGLRFHFVGCVGVEGFVSRRHHAALFIEKLYCLE